MEICSGTDPEPEVLKLIRPYCQQNFETTDGIEKHIRVNIMTWIRNLHNLSKQLQQSGKVNCKLLKQITKVRSTLAVTSNGNIFHEICSYFLWH